jgi:lipoprotein-releasing system permease protein
VFGIEPVDEAAASILPENMTSGSLAALAPGSDGLVLGASLARRLGLRQGDQVTLILPDTGTSGATVRPRMAVARLVGTFSVGSELDFHLGFMHVDDLMLQTGRPPELRLTLRDIFAAPVVSARLRTQGLAVRDWSDRYGDFFQTVRMEKVMMGILLFFVVTVAAFSIVSGLSMLVDSKRRDIAVLRTMGMDEAGIRRLFFSQGMLVTVLGVGLGVLLGLPLAYNVAGLMSIIESIAGFSIVEGTYFSQIPTDPRVFDIVVIVIVATVIGMLATLYPSMQAARLAPAEVLRYE